MKTVGGEPARKELDKLGAGSSDAITARNETKEQRQELRWGLQFDTVIHVL
jgi:hypothetical protein